jgi:hypothetical protein
MWQKTLLLHKHISNFERPPVIREDGNNSSTSLASEREGNRMRLKRAKFRLGYLFLVMFVALPNISQAADDDISARALLVLDRLPDYIQRSDVIIYGHIEIVDDSDDSLGQHNSRVLARIVPSEFLKGAEFAGDSGVAVMLENDYLPYKDWNISRGELRQIVEQRLSEFVQSYVELKKSIESLSLSVQEKNELLRRTSTEFETVFNRLTGGIITGTPSTYSIFEKIKLVRPSTPHLFFLEMNNESFDLVDEEYGTNIFFGLDAYILMAEISKAQKPVTLPP